MRQIVLLRGVNLGARNRIAMPTLVEAFSRAGHRDVRSYLQSGNVVLSSDEAPVDIARKSERLISQAFGLDIDVVVRTREELAEVVARNPLGDVATSPKRYQVSFLSDEPDPDLVERLGALAAPGERFVSHGRELYAWHPEGIGRSKLGSRLAGRGLGVTATARNWTTVTNLLDLAGSRD
jgi:uncharacterized protein (DUF1697 family)